MFCQNCGNKVDDSAAFCPECGAALKKAITPEELEAQTTPAPVPEAQPVQEPVYEQPGQYTQQTTEYPSGKGILTMGILAVALCEIGIGLIFGAIGLGRAKAYVRDYGKLVGTAKPGKILSMVGLIVGIIMAVFWLIYLLVIIVAIANY